MRWPHWRFTAALRLRSILRGRQVERELDEELQFHLEHKIEEGIASGLSADEARYAALRAMGGLEQRKEDMRDMRRIHWLTDFVDDVRYAIRGLRHTAGASALIIATLALGVGMTSAPFSMLDALVFRPYPVPHPGHVVSLVSTSRDTRFGSFSYREYLDLRARMTSYDGVVANAAVQGVGFSARPGTTPRVKVGMLVSSNYFPVLDVAPALGRGFRPDQDDAPGQAPTVVLAWDFWKREFGGDPSVVGRAIRLNGTDVTVVGVAPESFTSLLVFSRPDFYVPVGLARLFSTDPQKNFFEDRDDRELAVRARLKAGTSQRQAQSELDVILQDFARDHPAVYRDRGAAVHTQFEMRTRQDDVNWKFGVIFSVLSCAVLLVACTNVAGLLLSRATTRTREIAIRLALGAGRFRVVRLLLTESAILACLGGLGGIVLGRAAITMLRRFTIPAELPVIVPFQMDTRVLLTAVAFSAVSAIACGLAPALQGTRLNLVNGLKSSDADMTGRKRLWGRNLLVVAQVACSLMLLTAAFLMARGFQRALDEGTLPTKDHLLLAGFDPRLVQYDSARTRQFYTQLMERARGLPGVRQAALTQNPPLGLEDFDALAFVPEDVPMPRDREHFTSAMDTIDAGYFETLGIPLLRGRGVLASDTVDSRRVAVINDQFARHYWPGQDPIGKHLWIGDRAGVSVEIVGVAQALKYRDGSKREDFIYLPLAQHPVARMVLVLRSDGDPLELLTPLQDVVRTLDPNLPMLQTRSYADLYRYSAVDGPGMAVNLVGTMGAVGLLLAISGLYGLVAYNVSRRTREIGIRIAIGAVPLDIVRLVLRKGLALAGTGTAIGLAMGFGVERVMNAMVFDSGGVDLLAYAVVVPSLFVVTMLAVYVPARRASRIAPLRALQYQ